MAEDVSIRLPAFMHIAFSNSSFSIGKSKLLMMGQNSLNLWQAIQPSFGWFQQEILSLVRSVFGAANDLIMMPSSERSTAMKTVKLSLTIIPEPADSVSEQNNNEVGKSGCEKVTILVEKSENCKGGHCEDCGRQKTERRKRRRKSRSQSQPAPDTSELHELLRASLEENNVCYRNSQRYEPPDSQERTEQSKIHSYRLYDPQIMNEFDGLNASGINRLHYCRKARKSKQNRAHSHGRILELLTSGLELVPPAQCNHNYIWEA